MKHWKCNGCHHEWDGERSTCNWCEREGTILSETKSVFKGLFELTEDRRCPDCGMLVDSITFMDKGRFICHRCWGKIRTVKARKYARKRGLKLK